MKSNIVSFSPLCLFIAACAADIKETGGITRSPGNRHCEEGVPRVSGPTNFVDKAQWIPEKGFWAVLLADELRGRYGRIYKIDRNGEVVGTRDLVDEEPQGYCDGPLHGGPYYDGPGPYYYGGPPVVVGVYGHPYYHRHWMNQAGACS